MDDKREVIELVNKLQNYKTTTGCEINIQLPQIVVVGAQVSDNFFKVIIVQYISFYCISLCTNKKKEAREMLFLFDCSFNHFFFSSTLELW